MAYNIKIYNNASNTIHNLKGKKFDCRLTSILKKFQLTSQEEKPLDFIAEPPGSSVGTIFITAANLNFVPSLRAVIANIKRAFGVKQKIVAYDLGGILRNKVIQAYLEFDSFIYCDTSVHFTSNDFREHFNLINSGKVSPFLFGLGTYHGIKHATLQETFEYIPLFNGKHFDIEMQEANFIIVKRSEFTREILKWALLCAFTLDCIEPRKVPWDCPEEIFYSNRVYGLCHRMDQSVLSTLIYNAEEEIVGKVIV
uniref:Glucuronosyltransferase n=1 Tax=Meloidogyne floridensis TaxID=298350 RepID=A0A915NKD6_9BILA